ncbi:hypothetical protein M422DRAFT_56434 [Sphaerobolus stellatus SS14]|uniref:Uncharacterized protein n=1 Tax=Sphaerobolus stellatus (strain SS14) TaxID=990650 RepID=A0A0C9UFX7_SPHS4|nr:hypothetical protein M422DRAFT_56434 [Sphaerobolus stellatus SS14]
MDLEPRTFCSEEYPQLELLVTVHIERPDPTSPALSKLFSTSHVNNLTRISTRITFQCIPLLQAMTRLEEYTVIVDRRDDIPAIFNVIPSSITRLLIIFEGTVDQQDLILPTEEILHDLAPIFRHQNLTHFAGIATESQLEELLIHPTLRYIFTFTFYPHWVSVEDAVARYIKGKWPAYDRLVTVLAFKLLERHGQSI